MTLPLIQSLLTVAFFAVWVLAGAITVRHRP